MRILHTSDWHVGKTIRGHSRLDEHRAVLAEIVAVAARESVDVVLVAGDIFESAAPQADAQQLAFETLLDLRATGAEVIAIAGNHDHADHFESLRLLFREAGITVLGRAARPDEGGVVSVERGGETARIALLPFVSQRFLVRAEQLMALDAAQAAGHYAERMAKLIAALCEPVLRADAIGIVAAHCFVRGGKLGGGEREAQTIYDYGIDANVFPAALHYVALGHLHRQQSLAAGAAVWYSGAPLAVDFGESDDRKGVLLIEAAPGSPARVTPVPLTSYVPLRTLTGTLEELRELADDVADAWLRIRLTEPSRAGIADAAREIFPRAVDVQIVADAADALHRNSARPPTRRSRAPRDIFVDYLTQHNVDDARLVALFDELHDEVHDNARQRSSSGAG